MKKISKILIIPVIALFLPVFLSGCTDFHDINQKKILTAIALDKKDGEIYLYAEIANIEGGNNPEDKHSGSSHKYIYIKSHGKTIPEVRDNFNQQVEKEPYLSTIRTLILTEDFAKEYLVEYLYRIRADELYRKKIVTVITKENPEDMLKLNNEKNVSVGFSIEELLKTLDDKGESFSRTTARLIENLSDKYTGILLPCIGLHDKDTSLIGYSVVNGTTINGFIPVNDAKGTIFLKTDKPKFSYIVPYKDNKFTIDVSLKKRKIKSSYENGKMSFDIKFDFESKLMYGDKKTPYNFDDAANAAVTKTLEEMLKSDLTYAIDQAQRNFKCDYLQFDDEFRIKFPVEFESMEWQDEFQKASFNIDVKVILTQTHMMDYETNVRK